MGLQRLEIVGAGIVGTVPQLAFGWVGVVEG